MVDKAQRDLVVRDERRSLYVPVRTRPHLRDCWSVNVSRTGIGLGFSPTPSAPSLEEGSSLHLELSLPDTGTTLRAEGRVAWIDKGGNPSVGFSGTSLGVVFEEMAGSDRLVLAQYLSGEGHHVVVSDAPGPTRQKIRERLAGGAHIHFTNGPEELAEILGRGDITVVVIASAGADAGAECLQRVWSATEAMRTQVVAAHADVAPRVIYMSPASAAHLVELLNTGQVFRALTDPQNVDGLVHAVNEAHRDYGVRTEQHRATLALQRALSRRGTVPDPLRETRKAVTDVVVSSPAMRDVMALAQTAAPHRVSVLLQGETGVGKDVMARLIHELSDRSDEPFVVQDCGALTETLLESELFGHVKGAFTSAVASHPGLFALADGGTVFLDEIENTTPAMQAKLLRALENGQVRPVGGTKERSVDVRLIVASNRDLEAEVEAGNFRSDLFYRLNTFPIHVPPLRARPEDVLPLARHFLVSAARSIGRDELTLSPGAEAALAGHRWPGNIRELRNVIERAALLCGDSGQITPAQLPKALSAAPTPPTESRGSLRLRLAATEREMINAALEQNNGVIRRAAMELGMNPVTLARRMRRLDNPASEAS